MWQGSDSRVLGRADAATEHAALHFGFPNLLRLPDGDVLAAFWCREDCIHNIRGLAARSGWVAGRLLFKGEKSCTTMKSNAALIASPL